MKKNSQGGFSLFEVLVAISIFAVFFIVFANSFFHNQRASTELNQELAMSSLAEKVIRETLVAMPALSESLHKSNKKETFEAPNQDYTYTVEWSRLEFPNFGELMNAANPEEEASANQSIMNQVFKQVQEATKDVVWQMRLTIIHTASGREYPVSFWVKNPNKEITLSGVSGQKSPSGAAAP